MPRTLVCSICGSAGAVAIAVALKVVWYSLAYDGVVSTNSYYWSWPIAIILVLSLSTISLGLCRRSSTETPSNSGNESEDDATAS
jgi:hypothetical protein